MLFLIISAYILFEFILWGHRAVTMISSIRQYSIMPAGSWKPQEHAPRVSFIIPCRNESLNLPRLLPTLAAQDYPNLEIILIDDRSEDDTYEQLRNFAASHSNVIAVKGADKPAEWTGKAHALHQAVQRAKGEWLLFSDADTQHESHSVSSAMRHVLQNHIDFLTLTSHYLCESFWEYLIQPMAIGCFAVWFKLQKVNDPANVTPLACGHFILINQNAYKGLGGFESIKEEVLEDLALFKRAKSDGRYKFELSIGSHVFATRMYDSFGASWNGWRRIFMHSLDKNIGVYSRKICALVFNSLIPAILPLILGAVALRHPVWSGPFLGSAILLCFIYFLRSRSHKAIKAPFWPILFHPVSVCIVIGILLEC
ncbi:MAG: glycosyltransferase, partial [Candidatus Omnitrophica bacterium]|nr:glycosyltransferase [Candidatus Omnitrophota bacterium]